MIIDQSEIDALLNEAKTVEDELSAVAVSAPRPDPSKTVAARPLSSVQASSPEVRRLLRLRLPVIAVLAQRMISVSQVRKLSLGTIIEFEKNVDEPLELMINRKPVAQGDAVKVGDQFGLRIRTVRDPATLIRSMGK